MVNDRVGSKRSQARRSPVSKDIVTGPPGSKFAFSVMRGPALYDPSPVNFRNVAQTPSISSSVGSGGTAM
jgi:hypothetical protein